MKVYISADIEGITMVTHWSETEIDDPSFNKASVQMGREVLAACEGANDAGADEIVVKDAHGSARNIPFDDLPENVTLIRGWTNTPESMVAGLDNSFDAVVFVGYHSGAGYDGNPLSHTMNRENNYIKINGIPISEFEMHTYVAKYYDVPVVFLSGDLALCKNAKKMVPNIETVAVKKGIGNATFNINCKQSCKLIRSGVANGIEKASECLIDMPESFEMEINFKECVQALRASFYPGAKQIDSRTVRFTGKNIIEMMTARMFML